jgi:hypothetical protein
MHARRTIPRAAHRCADLPFTRPDRLRRLLECRAGLPLRLPVALLEIAEVSVNDLVRLFGELLFLDFDCRQALDRQGDSSLQALAARNLGLLPPLLGS